MNIPECSAIPTTASFGAKHKGSSMPIPCGICRIGSPSGKTPIFASCCALPWAQACSQHTPRKDMRPSVMTQSGLSAILHRGLQYLEEEQLPSGEIPNYRLLGNGSWE